MSHPKVPHPRRFLDAEHNWNDTAANWIVRIVGSPWCIWLFLTVPLVVLLAPELWQKVVFYLASGWVQLFMLPVVIYVAYKTDRLQREMANANHEALTHIAKTVDALTAVVAEQRAEQRAEIAALRTPARPARVAKKQTP